MGEKSKKSRKRSGGKRANQPQLSLFTTLYLDENICNCYDILAMLDAASVSYVRHLAIYPRDQYPDPVPDEVWLELVGQNGWTVITADKRNRYEPLEKAKIVQYKIREFIFTSGNLTGGDMAQILKDNLGKIDRLCKRTVPPLIASISRSGVTVRFPKPTKPVQSTFSTKK